MQHWTVILDYSGGASERVENIEANTAVLAASVARLCRTSPQPPTFARVFPQSGEPVGIQAAWTAGP